jgi:hypothetical protein
MMKVGIEMIKDAIRRFNNRDCSLCLSTSARSSSVASFTIVTWKDSFTDLTVDKIVRMVRSG